MTRIALQLQSASQRLALRRWLEARGHEVLSADDPAAELVLGDGPSAIAIPVTEGVEPPRIDFTALDHLLEQQRGADTEYLTISGIDAGPRELVAHSPAMRELEERLNKLAPASLAVLVTGEPGSGKEVIARALHERSDRRNEPFVAVNCAAIPESLCESELFGHEKGSFTDASQRRYGHFERAGAGTLFLDEIGELPLSMQAKLLRALQERSFHRIGGQESIDFPARVISASQDDLQTDPQFRPDLYHRIAGARLHVPPLRDRREDLPELCGIILAADSGNGIRQIEIGVLERIATGSWPGNVRQLENALRQAAIFSGGEILQLDTLETVLSSAGPAQREQFQSALRAWVAHSRAAGASAEELHEELLKRLEQAEKEIREGPDQGQNPKQ
ncbi:hypothetical protein DRQ53_02865 [bacterium]|nr:MAG: hypothetical protein DRQ32_09450 [bacterium]RKZ17669.1 MAG: hypothetical protein DRQ53_02865 [bacterium]